MNRRIIQDLNRREFLSKTFLAGTAMYLGIGNDLGLAATEPPPETTRLRIRQWQPACWAPIWVAEPLLREEGFTDIQYPSGPGPESVKMYERGEIDLSPSFAPVDMVNLEQNNHPVTFLAGMHVGCYALVGSERINSVRDLKGKTVWTGSVEDNGPHIFFKTIVSYVGLNPDTDVKYLWVNKSEAMQLFQKGKIDAFISFPPGPQELMDKGIGRLLVDTNVDRPWSQYFCCMISGQSDFVKKNPIATRRALRALLKANDIVAQNPELATRILLERKIRKESERKYVLQALKDIPYDKWRDYNPEETIRFYALRLREVGMLKTLPEDFIKNHTDWSFLNSLKEELAMTW
ncbi:MAG: ABC transporter substrate-binding protein [Desulfobulbaceae bacterium]|nr:ABC transporter substrate-binding protein [Desulfobulbaceae bacterium]